MPSLNIPGEHTPRLEAIDDTDRLRLVCQCGWSLELSDEHAWDEGWLEAAETHRREVT